MGINKMTQKDYLKKCKEVHNNLFDYSETLYTGALNKVKIKCQNGHTFEIRASDHTNRKRGCPHCYKDSAYGSLEKFIESAQKLHNNFDYSESVYVNNATKLKIKCPSGHIFFQTPNTHLSHKKIGCPECYGNRKLTQEEFIKNARAVHGDKYDYSESVYINSYTKLKIKCPNGHTFEIEPNNHINKKCGCGICYFNRYKEHLS